MRPISILILALAASVFLPAAASATEFFPTMGAAKVAAHGKRIAWICEGKDTLYYVGRRGEKHCIDRPRTTERKTKDGRVSYIAPQTQDNLRAGVVLCRMGDIRCTHNDRGHSNKQAVTVDAVRRSNDACHGGTCRDEFPRRAESALTPTPTAETSGLAAAGSMTSTWTEEFYPLLQGREEHAQFVPAVLIVTESKPIAATMMPVRLRSDWRTEAMNLLKGVLAVITVIGLGTFLVGEIQRLWQMREARQ